MCCNDIEWKPGAAGRDLVRVDGGAILFDGQRYHHPRLYALEGEIVAVRPATWSERAIVIYAPPERGGIYLLWAARDAT